MQLLCGLFKDIQLILFIFIGSKVRICAAAHVIYFHIASLLPPPEAKHTQPFTAVELDSHADVHGVVCDRHEANKASNDGWVQIPQDGVVGVPIALNYLEVSQTHPYITNR